MAHFPDLSQAPLISFDIEGNDPDLKTMGPGEHRNGYWCGIAVGTPDGFREYYPIRHAEGDNLDEHRVAEYLKEQLGNTVPKTGANLKYDISYLKQQNDIDVRGLLKDVQIAEPLIDENARFYNLDALGVKYLNEHKVEEGIVAACKERGYKGNPKQHLWRLPSNIVAPYAKGDVDLPIRILEKQEKIMDREGTTDLFHMECRLLELLIFMRRVGVRINKRQAEQVEVEIEKEFQKSLKYLEDIAGVDVKFNSNKSLAPIFDKMGVEYPLTAKGAPSFTKPWLQHHPSPVAKAVLECRRLDKFLGTFIRGTILNHLAGERIHCSFNQLKADEGGTVTGRFSSSNPNLQFIPGRDPVLGPLIRSMFIPEEGCRWGRADYSQVELRLLAHYAMGPGADDLRKAFNDNPRMDLHQWGADTVGVTRKHAKTINFGIVYGMGNQKLADDLGLALAEAKKLLTTYHGKMPFLKQTSNAAMNAAATRGYVHTVLNRRRRFNYWESADFRLSRDLKAMPNKEDMELMVQEARRERSAEGRRVPRAGVKRAGTYKALNAVIQGSAADVMKKAMVDCWDAGLFVEPGKEDGIIPHLTVHDELDVSVPRTRPGEEAFIEMTRLMERTIPFDVPLIVDPEIGENWGYCDDFKPEWL